MPRSEMTHSSAYLLSHWKLLFRVARSEVVARFAGSLLGFGWALLTPILMLLIYAAVYLLVFRVKVPTLTGPEYVVLIFTGLVPFLMSSEALQGGVQSVISNRAVLANTVFPVDLVPVKAVLIAQLTMVAGYALVLVAVLAVGRLSATILVLPVVWLLHVMFMTGLLWILSLVTLVFRDLQNMIGILLMFLMIASPIAYTPEMVPEGLKILLTMNPLAHFIVAYQDVIVYGRLPSAARMTGLTVMSLAIFAVGGYFFAHAKRTLLDYV